MTNRVHLARAAMRRAFEVRRDLNIEQHLPVCPFDAADRRGVEVWFSDVGSMEGLYFRAEPPRILIPADRPFGRQVFACAHELGHHELGHGTRLDEYLTDEPSDTSDPSEEYAAHTFGGAFLMPRAAVDRAFHKRSWAIEIASASQLFVVAGALGVSFDGLLTHLSGALRLLSRERANEIGRSSLPKIRESFLGIACTERLVVVDLHWEGIAIDLAVGENVLLPVRTSIAGTSLDRVESLGTGEWFKGVRPGVSRVVHPTGWAAFVRVRRQRFVGLGSIRHMDDPDVA